MTYLSSLQVNKAETMPDLGLSFIKTGGSPGKKKNRGSKDPCFSFLAWGDSWAINPAVRRRETDVCSFACVDVSHQQKKRKLLLKKKNKDEQAV